MSPTGGSGRSVTAGLLAWGLSLRSRTAVLDTGRRSTSPWPQWTAPRPGLAALPADQPLSRGQVLAATSQVAGPAHHGGGQWDVLTDHGGWSDPLLSLPEDPAAWYQLAAIGGWQSAVVDTTYAATDDLLTSRSGGSHSRISTWYRLPTSVPVWCAAATGAGVAALQSAVNVALAAGLPLHRSVIALVETGEGRMPARVRAAHTMLAPRVHAVVTVPFDAHIRSHGLADAVRIKTKTQRAATALTEAVVDAAQTEFGDPLPPAPQPRTLRGSLTSRSVEVSA
ncbi:hypothetical protein [Streptomyces sp. G-5]|uniref:hypothetical protein n=1 Tax=Streptomyces sp. G-5 TaxID=2977231 RepID=UPI0021D05030|nr:hypothetical protein [Streptomyces sp. G-5]MCU4750302.1 hypothetical protein [Streptomyces sp. G-5]